MLALELFHEVLGDFHGSCKVERGSVVKVESLLFQREWFACTQAPSMQTLTGTGK